MATPWGVMSVRYTPFLPEESWRKDSVAQKSYTSGNEEFPLDTFRADSNRHGTRLSTQLQLPAQSWALLLPSAVGVKSKSQPDLRKGGTPSDKLARWHQLPSPSAPSLTTWVQFPGPPSRRPELLHVVP